MNDADWFVEELKKELPGVVVSRDFPENPAGNQWLDVKWHDQHQVVEWRPANGFGFFAVDAGYGEGPEEVVVDRASALERMLNRIGDN